jgi:hypothetical protein
MPSSIYTEWSLQTPHLHKGTGSFRFPVMANNREDSEEVMEESDYRPDNSTKFEPDFPIVHDDWLRHPAGLGH